MYLRFTAQETRVNFALTYNFFMNGVAVRFTACNKKRKFNSNKKKKTKAHSEYSKQKEYERVFIDRNL